MHRLSPVRVRHEPSAGFPGCARRASNTRGTDESDEDSPTDAPSARIRDPVPHGVTGALSEESRRSLRLMAPADSSYQSATVEQFEIASPASVSGWERRMIAAVGTVNCASSRRAQRSPASATVSHSATRRRSSSISNGFVRTGQPIAASGSSASASALPVTKATRGARAGRWMPIQS
jgi:hypothetical protein